MDFISDSFPQTRLHISLFKVREANQTESGVTEFPDKLQEAKTALASIQKKYQSAAAFINAQFVINITHLNIAIAKALINVRDKTMKSQSLANEIVVMTSPSKSMDNCFDKYGIKGIEGAFFVVFVDCDSSYIAQIKSEVAAHCLGEVADLNSHLDWQDTECITKLFEVKEKEKTLAMPNALLTSLLTKVALKGL